MAVTEVGTSTVPDLERRVKTLRITGSGLHAFLGNGHHGAYEITGGLPQDASIAGTYLDLNGTLNIGIRSAEFPPIPEGEVAPPLEIMAATQGYCAMPTLS